LLLLRNVIEKDTLYYLDDEHLEDVDAELE
jgi:hypothetical protein